MKRKVIIASICFTILLYRNDFFRHLKAKSKISKVGDENVISEKMTMLEINTVLQKSTWSISKLGRPDPPLQLTFSRG